MKTFLLVFLLFAVVVGLYFFAIMQSRKKDKELTGGITNLTGAAAKASGETGTSVLPSHDEIPPASPLSSQAIQSFSLPEVTRQAIEQVKALSQTVSYDTLESAKAAVIAKAEADVLAVYGERGEAWEEAISKFHDAKQEAAFNLAVESGLTYYGALAELGYSIPQYMTTQRSSIDKQIDAERTARGLS